MSDSVISAICSLEGFSRFCGDCLLFHTEDCQHPLLANGGNPELVEADWSWACECIGWIEHTEPKNKNTTGATG